MSVSDFFIELNVFPLMKKPLPPKSYAFSICEFDTSSDQYKSLMNIGR